MNIKSFIALVMTAFSTFSVIVLSFLFLPMNVLENFIRCHYILIFKILGIKILVSGKENIDPEKSYIYISNHSSLLDIPSVKIALPISVKFIAKKELFGVPLFGFALKRIGTISIDRGNRRKAIESLKIAQERLHTGTSIWMAPEGTRNIDGIVKDFKKGAFVTAAKAGVQVVPVSLCGTWKALPKKSFKVASGRIDVQIHKPISVNEEDISASITEAHQLISDDVLRWKQDHE